MESLVFDGLLSLVAGELASHLRLKLWGVMWDRDRHVCSGGTGFSSEIETEVARIRYESMIR